MADKESMKAANLVKDLFGEVKEDLRKEEIETAKALIKEKLAALSQAQKVVANIEREIEDLKLKLANQFKASLMSRRLDLNISGRQDGAQWLVEVPIPLQWCGWSSDTVTLQRHGWQFSMDNSLHTHALLFAMMNSRINARGTFTMSRIEFVDDVRAAIPPKEAEVHLAEKMRLIISGADAIGRRKWRPVDVREMKALGLSEHAGYDIDEIALFRPLPASAPDNVYLHEANLEQVLEHALKLQEPTQAEIRQRILEEKERRKYGSALIFDSEPKVTLRLLT